MGAVSVGVELMTGVGVGLDVGVVVSKGVDVAEGTGTVVAAGLAEGTCVALEVGVCRTSEGGVVEGGRDVWPCSNSNSATKTMTTAPNRSSNVTFRQPLTVDLCQVLQRSPMSATHEHDPIATIIT